MSNSLDTSSINNISNIVSPISVFVMISFVCVVWIITYKSVVDRFPSISTLFTMLSYIVVSIAVLILLGHVSTTLEWTCVILLTLFLLMSTFAVLYPDVFFYPELS